MDTLLLAGPMVRRVDVRSVSVWVATSKAVNVELSLFEGLVGVGPGTGLVTDPAPRNTANRDSIRIGEHLHICVVTLILEPPEQLFFGHLYSYNIKLNDEGVLHDLKSLGLLTDSQPPEIPHVALGYEPNTLPGFCTPPPELDNLNIYHASCRKPHGQDPEALDFLDSEIKAGLTEPEQRPHQAFLTGDQIYADDIPISLLPYLSELGRELIGTDEKYQLGDGTDVTINEQTLPAGLRKWFTYEFTGFSTSDADSHLLSLGEYCAAYLFSFSNISWPDMVTPHPQDSSIPASLADVPFPSDIDLAHLEPDLPAVKPAEDYALRHRIFRSADPPDVPGRLFFFFNNLTTKQRIILESPKFDLDKDDIDDIVKQMLKFDLDIRINNNIDDIIKLIQDRKKTDDDYAFLVNEAIDTANKLHPEEERERTLKLFFWLVTLRRKAWAQVRPADPSNRFLLHTIHSYYEALPRVRRALANVATYMIFDDHDITDDWNVNRAWEARVHGKPLGKAVLRSALVSYAAFQGWGNDPAAFISGPNKEVLEQSELLFKASGSATPDQGAADKLDALFRTDRSPRAEKILDDLFGTDGSPRTPRWDYEVPGTVYKAVVLDTRSQRDFPGVFGAPALISKAALDQQLPEGPLSDGKQVLIVVSAAPILDLAVLEEIVKPIAIRRTELNDARENAREGRQHEFKGDAAFDLESWSANRAGFELIIKRLASFHHVLVLSGDVHFGASAELSYWEKLNAVGVPLTIPATETDPARIEWRQNLKPESRIVQFTSSAAKNQVPMADAIFLFSRTSFAQRVQRLDVPLERLGWDDPAIEPVQLSTTAPTPPSLRARLGLTPVLVPTFNWPEGTTFRPFEWSWRLLLLQDKRPDLERPQAVHPINIDVEDPVTPENAFETYRAVARRHADSLDKALFGRQMVFATNIGRVGFSTADETLVARHDLLAVHPNDPLSIPAPYTRHEASLIATEAEPPVPGVPRTASGEVDG